MFAATPCALTPPSGVSWSFRTSYSDPSGVYRTFSEFCSLLLSERVIGMVFAPQRASGRLCHLDSSVQYICGSGLPVILLASTGCFVFFSFDLFFFERGNKISLIRERVRASRSLNVFSTYFILSCTCFVVLFFKRVDVGRGGLARGNAYMCDEVWKEKRLGKVDDERTLSTQIRMDPWFCPCMYSRLTGLPWWRMMENGKGDGRANLLLFRMIKCADVDVQGGDAVVLYLDN